MTLVAFAAERRAAGRPPLSIDLLPAAPTAANPPHAAESDRKTDGHGIIT